MEDLETYKLEDLGFLGRGKSRHRPRNDPSLFGGKYPFIQTGEVKSAEFYINSYDETYNEKGIGQSKLWDSGTLLITIAANIAETAILDIKACFPDSILGFIPDEDKADVRFIKYYIDTIKLKMQSISRGTTQDNLSLQKLRSIDFNVPPVSKQKRIADVLTAFDDLIANNSRRIEILEEMARRIYREWFVHFRYPGHEEDKLVDSGTELGEIPEGWEVKEFGELVEYLRDRVKKEEVEEEVSVLGLGDMPKESIDLSQWENTDDIGSTKLRFKKDDILFGKIRPYFHKVGFAQTNGVCSSDIFVWRPHENKDYVLALLTASSDKFVETATNSSSGTKMPRAKWDVLEKYLIAYPSKELLEKLNSLVGSSLKQIRTLSFQNKKLKETRDLLLPKLISGEIGINEDTLKQT